MRLFLGDLKSHRHSLETTARLTLLALPADPRLMEGSPLFPPAAALCPKLIRISPGLDQKTSYWEKPHWLPSDISAGSHSIHSAAHGGRGSNCGESFFLCFQRPLSHSSQLPT